MPLPPAQGAESQVWAEAPAAPTPSALTHQRAAGAHCPPPAALRTSLQRLRAAPRWAAQSCWEMPQAGRVAGLLPGTPSVD